jgi:hypothetical protein
MNLRMRCAGLLGRTMSILVVTAASLASSDLLATGANGVFVGDFVQGQTPSAQASQDWVNFRQTLVPASYNTVKISGTFDPAGRVLHDALIVPQIATALKNGTAGSWTAGGFTWKVNSCGGNGFESPAFAIMADDIGGVGVCGCPNPAWLVRPNIGNSNWGGANTDTCSPPSQRLAVVFSNVETIFKIDTLTANNVTVVETDSQISDDSGGLAVSSAKTFLTGDGDTAIYNRSDLSSPGTVGQARDSMVMNIHTETVYTLADSGGNPIPSGGGTVTQLIELDANTGALTATAINLSSPITLSTSAEEVGIFAGYDRIVLVDGSNLNAESVYNIDLPSGLVKTIGTIGSSAVNYHDRSRAENWATYGVAEFFDGAVRVAYIANGSNYPRTQIFRTNVTNNAEELIVDFAPNDLSDGHEFTVVPSLQRWYFHYEGGDNNSIAGGSRDEPLAFADATFTIVPTGTMYVGTGSNGVAGNLYTVDPVTATATLVGPITNASGGGAIGVTGLDFNPVTAALYGVTSNLTTSGGAANTVAASLITINPNTAVATVIGSLGGANSDISLRTNGTLFGFQTRSSPSMTTINTTTGAATAVGSSGLTQTRGGGLAFSPSGLLYLSATSGTGTLDTLDPATGARTVGPTLTGAPLADSINAMAFNSAGVLFASDSDRGSSPATVHLVTIDPNTGAVSDVGALPGDTDAIAIVPSCDSNPPTITVPHNITVRTHEGTSGCKQVHFHTSASDAEDGTIATVADPPSGTCFHHGKTTVTVTATDSCGNTATKTFQVRVKTQNGRRH